MDIFVIGLPNKLALLRLLAVPWVFSLVAVMQLSAGGPNRFRGASLSQGRA